MNKIDLFTKLAQVNPDPDDELDQEFWKAHKEEAKSTIPPPPDTEEDLGDYETIMKSTVKEQDFSRRTYLEFQIYDLCDAIKEYTAQTPEKELEAIRDKLIKITKEHKL